MACPWYNKYREHLSDGACFLYPNDRKDNLIHVHDDTQYSTDPIVGGPFAWSYADELDPCTMTKFSLNRRVCSVETEIESDDVHVAAYTPKNAVQLWSMVRSVIDKWTEFYRRTGYWPSVCTVTDAVVNTTRVDDTDDEPTADSVRSIRPVHFVKDCSSLATAIDRLICIWFENYYSYVLNVRDKDRLREILRGASSHDDFTTTVTGNAVTTVIGGRAIKARRIECDMKDYAGGFWERHDTQKYRNLFAQRDNTISDGGWISMQCRLKQIVDKKFLERFESGKHCYHQGGGFDNNTDGDDNSINNGDNIDIDIGDLTDGADISMNAKTTARRKSLFHACIVDTFGNHRDYPHTIMCREFIVKDKRFCSIWLDMVRKFAGYRLCRLKHSSDEDEEEKARTAVRQIMKEWNSLFPNLSESARQRKRDIMKLMRKKRRNDNSIAAEFGKAVSENTAVP